MSQIIQVHCKGLHTAPNEVSAVPDGALLLADNCVIGTDNLVEPRRGLARYRTAPITTDRFQRFEWFQNIQMSKWSNGYLGYDNGTTITTLGTSYADPDANLARSRFLGAQSNLYVTTSTGVFKTDTYTTAPWLSGAIKGLDLSLALPAAGAGFFTTGNQIAYRVVWGYYDANNTLYLGAPSGRAIITNSSGTDDNCTVTFTVPSAVTASAPAYFYQVYRSKLSGGATVLPDDELGLVYQNNVTAANIAAGTITFTDSTPVALLGATIYTAPSQQGIGQSNERPPVAWDIEEFQTSIVYANVTSKQRLSVTLLSASALVVNDTVTVASFAYTAKAAEDIVNHQFKQFTSGTPAQNIQDTASSLIRCINRDSRAQTVYAYYLSGPTDLPGQILLEERGIGGATFAVTNTVAYTFTVSAANATVGATYTNSGNTYTVTATIAGATTLICSGTTDPAASGTLTYASGTGDATITYSAFTKTTSPWNPVLPTTGTTVSSSSNNFTNGLMFSKSGVGEAVPLLNVLRVGSANNRILRIKKLRNSLFILKEREGIYRMTGTDPTNFIVDLFDSSARLLAPDTVEVCNNQIWCLTDQGITTITETGVSVVSRPIENQILDQFAGALTQVQYYSFGVAYETERQYQLWTVSTSSDTVASQCFIFNIFTQSYTRWPLSKSTGKVSPVDGKLYYGDGTTYNMDQERKNRNYTDYVDFGTAYNITSTSGYTIYMTSTGGIAVGDIVYQSASIQSQVTAVQPAYVTVVDSLTTWAAGACTVYSSYLCTLEYSAMTAGNPGTVKQFPEISMLFRAAFFNSATVSLQSDFSGYFDDVTIAGFRSGLWGLFAWGGAAWGGTALTIPIRTLVPLEQQRGSFIRVKFTMQQGYGYFQMNGWSMPARDTGSFQLST